MPFFVVRLANLNPYGFNERKMARPLISRISLIPLISACKIDDSFLNPSIYCNFYYSQQTDSTFTLPPRELNIYEVSLLEGDYMICCSNQDTSERKGKTTNSNAGPMDANWDYTKQICMEIHSNYLLSKSGKMRIFKNNLPLSNQDQHLSRFQIPFFNSL